MLALTNARVLTPTGFEGEQAVVIDGDTIHGIVPHRDIPSGAEIEDLNGDMLVPGFIDTQVNGGGGVLFNSAPTVETIEVIGTVHARYGTTGFLPTLISDDLETIRAGIAAVDAAIDRGVPGVLGIHIEGPFINVERKGIHDARHIRPLDDEAFDVLTGLKRGRTMLTIAPERTTPAMIARLVAAGVRVSAGHTDGRYDDIMAGIDAGLTGFTHLFNAMSQLGNREPGAVGAALSSDEIWCGLIVDGFHVSPVTMKLALRCKPADRFMLVTDAMPTTGSDLDEFTMQGRRIVAREGRLLDESGTLAGSDLTMIDAVRNAVAMLDVSVETALGMASRSPAGFLGLQARYGEIRAGYRASLVRVSDELAVRDIWIDGLKLSRS